MGEDLNLIGYRFNIIILVFFPTYIIFNPVATVLARKLGPRPFLAGVTFSFGLVVVGFGLAKNWRTQVRYMHRRTMPPLSLFAASLGVKLVCNSNETCNMHR